MLNVYDGRCAQRKQATQFSGMPLKVKENNTQIKITGLKPQLAGGRPVGYLQA